MSKKYLITHKRYQRGNVILPLLMWLFAIVLLILLFDDEMMRIYRQQFSQQKISINTQLNLQYRSNIQTEIECAKLDLFLPEDSYLLTFSTYSSNLPYHQYTWCIRDKLFKQQPKKNILMGELEHYLHMPKRADFIAQVMDKNNMGYFYWFTTPQASLQIDRDMYGIIVAIGDLSIEGNGRIRGAIITGGSLLLGDNVSVAYNKDVAEYFVKWYSRWHQAEKSWHDFTSQE